MKNKRLFVISIGTFTVISLALALFLSSLRSYKSTDLNILDESSVILGVEFNNRIKNAREIVDYQYMANKSLNIINSNTPRAQGARATGSTDGSQISGAYNAGGSLLSKYSKGNGIMGSESVSGNVRTSSGSTQGVNLGMYSSIPSNSKTKKININGGVATLTTDLTIAKNAGTKFSAGGPPPSEGNDAPPPTLPIGDGMTYMLLLLAAFTGLKAKKIFFN